MAFNFLDEVNNRLAQPRQRKSRLASYFEAHYEFQEAYKSPSPSRSPSPELANIAPSPWPAHVSRKRSWSSADDGSDSSTASVPAKRMRTGLNPNHKPLTRTRSRAGIKRTHNTTFDDGFAYLNMGGLYVNQQILRPRPHTHSVGRNSGVTAKSMNESRRYGSQVNNGFKISKKHMILAKVQSRISGLKAVRQNGRYVFRHTPARISKAIRGPVHTT